jgi:hypothetical protein
MFDPLKALLSPEEADVLDDMPNALANNAAFEAKAIYDAGLETVTTGACSITKRITQLSVTGTKGYTLADGTSVGQEKVFVCSVAASTPVGTLTPAHALGFSTVVFNTVGDAVTFVWNGTAWERKVMDNTTTTANAAVVAAFNTQAAYDVAIETTTSGACSITKQTTQLSVTGTQAYTLADGTAVGQKKILVCTVAASTPVGTLTPANALGFSTIVFNTVGDAATLEWNGTAWVRIMMDNTTTTANAAVVSAFNTQVTYDTGIETVASGVCSVVKKTTLITIDGTKAYSLANGSTVGQVKVISCTAAINTPAGTVTPATALGYTSLAFDAANDCAVLQWTASGWMILSLNSVTAS